MFKLNSDSKVVSVDGAPYKSDTYAGNYTNVDSNTLVNVNWNGNWLYSPIGANEIFGVNMYKYFTEHSGSFALPRLIQNDNGQLTYIPIEPNNQLVVSYKTDNNGQGSPMVANTNNKLDFSFDNLNSVKTINLSREQSNITITIGNGNINVTRYNELNERFSKDSTIPLNVSNISKLEMYVDNASIELYLPESKQSYNIVNLSTKQNEPYKMTVNTEATIDNYEFNANYPSLSANEINNVIDNLRSNVSNDSEFNNSLSSIIKSYASNNIQDHDYINLSSLVTSVDDKLSMANDSVSMANSYVSKANAMSNDSRSSLYLVLASSAYADASNAENYSLQSILSARNLLATKAPSATGNYNGSRVINGHNVMFIDGKEVSGEIITDSDGQSHYYDSINGYEGINLFYKDGSNYYYFNKNGNMVKNQFVAAIPNTDYNYYFGTEGKAVNGKQVINGVPYLFVDNIQVKNSFINNSDGTLSYYDNNGSLVTSTANINGKTFNFDKDGKLIAPNQFIDYPTAPYSNYYLDNNNQLTKGFKYINGNWYYFDNNGNMARNIIVKDSNGLSYTADINGILSPLTSSGVKYDKYGFTFSPAENNNTPGVSSAASSANTPSSPSSAASSSTPSSPSSAASSSTPSNPSSAASSSTPSSPSSAASSSTPSNPSSAASSSTPSSPSSAASSSTPSNPSSNAKSSSTRVLKAKANEFKSLPQTGDSHESNNDTLLGLILMSFAAFIFGMFKFSGRKDN